LSLNDKESASGVTSTVAAFMEKPLKKPNWHKYTQYPIIRNGLIRNSAEFL
jgi:hypothetical protein